MSLCRLIYCSNSVPDLDYANLLDIMEKSEKNNKPLGITGMLCYGNSMFLQMLEGDRKYISTTYNRIALDKRHFNTEIIDFSEIETRLFSQWSMKVVQLGEFAQEKVRVLSTKYCSIPIFAPSYMTTNQCLNFMVEFGTLLN